MKKIFIITGILIITAVLAIPYANGLIAENTLHKAVTETNSRFDATGTGYSLEIIHYDRGYLTSDIEWKIDLGMLKNIYPIDSIVLKSSAKHEYSGVMTTTTLQENSWYKKFITESLQGRDPLHITTRYGLSGNIKSSLELDAFSVEMEGETIDVHAGQAALKTDRKMKDLSTSGKWEGLSIADKAVLKEMSMDSDLTMYSPYLWAGDINYHISKIAIHEKNERLELNDLNVNYTLSVSEDRLKTSAGSHLSVGEVSANNKKIDKASMQMAVQGVDAKGYEEFLKLYIENLGEMLGNIAALEKKDKSAAEAVKRQMITSGMQMMAAYEKMLKKDLEFTISDLDVQLADGQISGSFTLKLLKDMTFMQFAPVARQPELLFDIFALKSDLRLPSSLVSNEARLLKPAFPGMQTGVFLKQGDILVHQAETSNGKLILNGHEVVLPGQNGS